MIAALTNHLWQSTLFACAAGLMAFALRKNGAHVRHLVWLAASVKFLVPFALLLRLGHQWAWTTTAPLPGTDAPALETASVVMDQIAQPFTAAFQVTTAAPPAGVDWPPVLAIGLWAFGCAAVVWMRVRAWTRIRAIVRASVARTIRGVEVPPRVNIRVSPGLLEPGVIGFWRPILLLPAGIEEQLTPLQLEAVLAHEFCHIRRRDNVTSAIHMLVEAVFWFHPLAWWIGARIVDERERACDEHVLRVTGRPEVYAEGIVNVCKLYVESPLKCVSGVTGANLKKRIEAILFSHVGLKLNLARKAAIVLAAVFTVAAPVFIGTITAAASARNQATAGESANQKFEVASVKPCSAEAPPAPPAGGGARSGGGAGPGGGGAFGSSPGRVHIDCVRLAVLVDTAYIQHGRDTKAFDGWGGMGSTYSGASTGPLKVRGGPSWVYDGRWTIDAKAATAADEDTMLGPMLRALLEDRFHLKLHTESEDVPVWTLNVAKGGLKITPIKDGECNADRTAGAVPVSRAIKEGIKPTCNTVSGGPDGTNWRWEHGGQGLSSVASMLSVDLGAPVLDRTGVTGKFNIVWEYGPDENTPRVVQIMERFAPGSGPPTAATLFTALEEQLGLKLEKIKGSRRYIAIDKVDRPAPDAPAARPTPN